jgi:hypothetical protein
MRGQVSGGGSVAPIAAGARSLWTTLGVEFSAAGAANGAYRASPCRGGATSGAAYPRLYVIFFVPPSQEPTTLSSLTVSFETMSSV